MAREGINDVVGGRSGETRWFRNTDVGGGISEPKSIFTPAGANKEKIGADSNLSKPDFLFVGESANLPQTVIKKLEKAKKLYSMGINRTSIWRSTGWGIGKDGKWRYEIQDPNILFQHITYSGTPLEKLLSRKEL